MWINQIHLLKHPDKYFFFIKPQNLPLFYFLFNHILSPPKKKALHMSVCSFYINLYLYTYICAHVNEQELYLIKTCKLHHYYHCSKVTKYEETTVFKTIFPKVPRIKLWNTMWPCICLSTVTSHMTQHE